MNRTDNWLAEAERYADECRERRCAPRATELALRLKVTPVQLDRGFRACAGTKIGEFLKRRQIEIAKTLLLDPALTTAAVAARAGFATPRSFFRAFRRTTGTTPGTYRREKNVTGAHAPNFLN